MEIRWVLDCTSFRGRFRSVEIRNGIKVAKNATEIPTISKATSALVQIVLHSDFSHFPVYDDHKDSLCLQFHGNTFLDRINTEAVIKLYCSVHTVHITE